VTIPDLGDHGDRLAHFPDSQVIFIKGAPGDFAYVVKSGRVEIREGGRVLETLGPGGLFGEMAMIDAAPRSASAVAVGPTDLVVIDHATFDALIREVPDFAISVMRLMARRLRATTANHPAPEEIRRAV
jgi:CRP-like cAMP-binding protein